jgi:DNA-directed RNA polymerase specialized sigma24 family protein
MVMEVLVVRWAASTVSLDPVLEREFEARLAESARLAFRVAYGVLRHREDAEDVAQEGRIGNSRGFRIANDSAAGWCA